MMTLQHGHGPLTPPRHAVRPERPTPDSYQRQLERIEREFGAMLDRLNLEYVKLLDIAGQAFARAAERAVAVRSSIAGPADTVYSRQLELADKAAADILTPAKNELVRLTGAAEDMRQRAIAPIETAYRKALSELQQASQGMSLVTGSQTVGG